jgi:hypothetical protein
MIPTWIIEELERQRAGRERQERPALHIEAPVHAEREPRPSSQPRTVIVIDILGECAPTSSTR